MECCHPDLDPARTRRAAAGVNWPGFVDVVDRHRIAGLAVRALAGIVPERWAAELADRGRRDAAANLRAAAACAELERRFAAAGVRRLYLKGLTLSVLAYGSPSIKASADIDILVAPDDIAAAVGVLVEAGFALADPAGLPLDRLGQWHRHHKETNWVRGADRVAVDLHSRLADSPALLTLGVDAPAQRVAVGGGIVLPTLAADLLPAYLAVHGASSCWFRLKWIADFAALCGDLGAKELEREAAMLGAERPMAQALLLANALFGLFGDRRDPLLASRANRRMVALALGTIGGREPTERRLGTLAIHRNQLLMKAGPRFVAGEAWRQARAAWSNRMLRGL